MSDKIEKPPGRVKLARMTANDLWYDTKPDMTKEKLEKKKPRKGVSLIKYFDKAKTTKWN